MFQSQKLSKRVGAQQSRGQTWDPSISPRTPGPHTTACKSTSTCSQQPLCFQGILGDLSFKWLYPCLTESDSRLTITTVQIEPKHNNCPCAASNNQQWAALHRATPKVWVLVLLPQITSCYCNYKTHVYQGLHMCKSKWKLWYLLFRTEWGTFQWCYSCSCI